MNWMQEKQKLPAILCKMHICKVGVTQLPKQTTKQFGKFPKFLLDFVSVSL